MSVTVRSMMNHARLNKLPHEGPFGVGALRLELHPGADPNGQAAYHLTGSAEECPNASPQRTRFLSETLPLADVISHLCVECLANKPLRVIDDNGLLHLFSPELVSGTRDLLQNRFDSLLHHPLESSLDAFNRVLSLVRIPCFDPAEGPDFEVPKGETLETILVALGWEDDYKTLAAEVVEHIVKEGKALALLPLVEYFADMVVDVPLPQMSIHKRLNEDLWNSLKRARTALVESRELYLVNLMSPHPQNQALRRLFGVGQKSLAALPESIAEVALMNERVGCYVKLSKTLDAETLEAVDTLFSSQGKGLYRSLGEAYRAALALGE